MCGISCSTGRAVYMAAKDPLWDPIIVLAERVGFEPTDPARDHLISSQARSASSGTSP